MNHEGQNVKSPMLWCEKLVGVSKFYLFIIKDEIDEDHWYEEYLSAWWTFITFIKFEHQDKKFFILSFGLKGNECSRIDQADENPKQLWKIFNWWKFYWRDENASMRWEFIKETLSIWWKRVTALKIDQSDKDQPMRWNLISLMRSQNRWKLITVMKISHCGWISPVWSNHWSDSSFTTPIKVHHCDWNPSSQWKFIKMMEISLSWAKAKLSKARVRLCWRLKLQFGWMWIKTISWFDIILYICLFGIRVKFRLVSGGWVDELRIQPAQLSWNLGWSWVWQQTIQCKFDYGDYWV